jgi:hypothetical protein
VDQSPQGFASEDEEATYCLSLLRDGDRHQKIVARERLSQIFERRGMLDEAASCLESNIREGVRDPRVYQRLAGVYRRQGRHELADEVLVEARRLAERMARPQPPGARRPGPGRPGPGRPSQPTPPPPNQQPNPLQAPTAQLPAAMPPPARPAAVPPPPPGGGELELDRLSIGPRAGVAYEQADGDVASIARPWWVSPAALVLLVLLCGPYGLALMWVRGGYSKQTRVRVTAIWAALMVLMCLGTAVTAQSQMTSLIAGSAGLGGLPGSGVAATPIVFPSAAGATAKPGLPPGFAPSPPAISASPGLQPSGAPGTIISPAATAEAKPAASPGAVAQNPDSDDAKKVKVKDTGGTGANLRDKPGQTGTVVKTIPEGTVLDVIGEDRPMDGKNWKNVKDDEGTVGWMAAELLEPA